MQVPVQMWSPDAFCTHGCDVTGEAGSLHPRVWTDLKIHVPRGSKVARDLRIRLVRMTLYTYRAVKVLALWSGGGGEKQDR
jgi:hypothetical protein